MQKNTINIFENLEEKPTLDDLLINAKNIDILQTLDKLVFSILEENFYPYNPILLKGRNGCGKTFLLQNLKKRFNQTEEIALFFHTRELIHFLNSRTSIINFLEKIEPYHVIIIDDIHLLKNYPNEQAELAYIIENIIDTKKNIIISLNINPEIEELDTYLISRLSMGLMLVMPDPDLDLRMQFIQIALEALNLKLKKDLCLIIARQCHYYRQLKSVSMNIKVFYDRLAKLPNKNDIDRIIQNSGINLNLDHEYIINIVARHYGFNPKDIKSKRRENRLLEARQIAMYISRKLLGETYSEIGKFFGGKDHTTVIYSIRKIEKIILTNKVMHKEVTELTNMCKTSLIYEHF